MPVRARGVTEGNDGYLSASEIAGLKLDADWGILSACNTAAGRLKARRRFPVWHAHSFTLEPVRY